MVDATFWDCSPFTYAAAIVPVSNRSISMELGYGCTTCGHTRQVGILGEGLKGTPSKRVALYVAGGCEEDDRRLDLRLLS